MKNAYPQFKTWNDTILAYAFEYASTPIDGDIASIDLQRLFLQWCMLVIFIGSIVLVLREKKNHEA